MTMGGPYKWKPNDVPPPGYYDVDENKLKPRVPATIIRQEQLVYYQPPRMVNWTRRKTRVYIWAMSELIEWVAEMWAQLVLSTLIWPTPKPQASTKWIPKCWAYWEFSKVMSKVKWLLVKMCNLKKQKLIKLSLKLKKSISYFHFYFKGLHLNCNSNLKQIIKFNFNS